jgi:membrane protein
MPVLRHLRGSLRRVFPDVPIYAQAVAFAGFLTFFPILLLLLSALATSDLLSAAVEELFSRMRAVLPPGSQRLVVNYLTEQGGDPNKWLFLGIGGTLLGGMQVMSGLMLGFRAIYRDTERPGFWRDQLRALLLISLTIGPWAGAVVLTVFGRQVREWMIDIFGLPGILNTIWGAIFTALAFVLGMITLSLIYHFGRPHTQDWNRVWPGTLVATLLWWVVNAGFGIYVSKVPYSVVYGGLAAVIGLLVWIYLSTMVIFIGAGYNAAYFPELDAAAEPINPLSITEQLVREPEDSAVDAPASPAKESGPARSEPR